MDHIRSKIQQEFISKCIELLQQPELSSNAIENIVLLLQKIIQMDIQVKTT